MDVNGTRFQLLLGEDDWAACSDGRVRIRPASVSTDETEAADLAWNPERSELTLRPLLFQFVTPPKDTPPSLSVRRGAAQDRYGNWYWVDATARRVLVLRYGEQAAETFWPVEGAADTPSTSAGEFAPKQPETHALTRFLGLTVTDDQYMVVGMLEPAGLLVFDLYDTTSPLRILWPDEVPFSPFDMAAAPTGGLWILDRDNRRFWGLDRHFNIIPQGQDEVTLGAGGRDDFQPRDAAAGRRKRTPNTFPAGVSLDLASPLTADDPVSIEALPDGTVLILDRNPTGPFSLVYRYDFQRQLGRPVSTSRMERLVWPEDRGAFSLSAFDFAFVPAHDEPEGRVSDRLYFAAADGNQVFAFAVSEQGEQLLMEPLPDYLPMRMFGGKGLVAVGTQLYYDFGGGWIPLVEQKRPRFLQEATLYTPVGIVEEEDDTAPHAFDGREPDCVWNRLMLDACIPPETEVSVESRAANDERELVEAEWRPEPHPYLRGDGGELPFARRPTTAAGDGTWELLFQKARGRYLQLRLTLKGNGRTTPRLRALRAYYPRFSYLEQYMPAVYREDEVSASFLDRFLSNFEGFYTSLEDRVAAAQSLFDVRSAPAEALEWLAGWFGLALDPTWDETRRRLLIKHAPTFFQARGTVRGLRWALRLALDDCPSDEIFDESCPTCARGAGGIRIIERYRTRQTPGVVLGDPTDASKRLNTTATRWRPEQGRNALDGLLRGFVTEKDAENLTKETAPSLVVQSTEYTLRPTPEFEEQWSRFSLAALGFIPAATADETALWQDFLKRRHRQIQQLNILYKTSFDTFAEVYLPGDMPVTAVRLADWLDFVTETAPSSARRSYWQNFLALRYRRVGSLNEAYGTHWPSFEVVSLPEELPADGAPLRDWYQFESVVLPMRDASHRFTVLLPMRNSADPDDAEGLQRRSVAERVVNLEKPAHTTFDIKFYWELFRLGEARLGEDTLINLGGRAPQLMTPLTLGRGRLAESYITARQATPADRQVLGRDPLAG
ncbi:MAG TPA: phage tail protein [Pyrinomonadaceae bacterium]|nr:phage tail protein [Pyrinomonadaceae bacterium]